MQTMNPDREAQWQWTLLQFRITEAIHDVERSIAAWTRKVETDIANDIRQIESKPATTTTTTTP